MTAFAKPALALLFVAAAAAGADPKPTPATAAEMAEDVEVLRRLLNKAFGFSRSPGQYPEGEGQTYVSGTRVAYRPPSPVPLLPESFDGVYLKGHGVAYTIRLASPTRAAAVGHEKADGLVVTCQNCHAADAAKFNLQPPASTKPPTDWEKARDELRGGSPKADPNAPSPNVAEVCFPGALTETVTKLLAANGRHLRHLTADESVSVVVTYAGQTGAAHDRVTGTMADPALWDPKAPATDATVFGLTPYEAKQIVLGDLHLKQGKHAEAVTAYETALARYTAATVTIAAPRDAKFSDVQAALGDLRKSVTAAHRSLAQAYIGAGSLDAAKRSLELAQNLKVSLGVRDRMTPVPAKIVLTVKKGHLDAAEKLSPADFRKGVSVEMVGLTATKK